MNPFQLHTNKLARREVSATITQTIPPFLPMIITQPPFLNRHFEKENVERDQDEKKKRTEADVHPARVHLTCLVSFPSNPYD